MADKTNSSHLLALAENKLVGLQIHDATQQKIDILVSRIKSLNPSDKSGFNKLKLELIDICTNYFSTMQEIVVNNSHHLKNYARK